MCLVRTPRGGDDNCNSIWEQKKQGGKLVKKQRALEIGEEIVFTEELMVFSCFVLRIMLVSKDCNHRLV